MGMDSLQLKCVLPQKFVNTTFLDPNFFFSPKICKYNAFCPKICKNALIDDFLRIPAVIDSSASSAGLGWVLAHVIVLARDMLLYCVMVLAGVMVLIYLVR